jgi:hypothetical protein
MNLPIGLIEGVTRLRFHDDIRSRDTSNGGEKPIE